MFSKEEVGRQNLASNAMATVIQESKSLQTFYTQHLDFPTSRLSLQKDDEWELISEIQTSSKPQENQSLHEVDEFREEDQKQLEREGSCPRREFRYSDRGQTRGLESTPVNKSSKKTRYCISRIRQNTTSYQGESLELY